MATGERYKALQGKLPVLSKDLVIFPVKACKPFNRKKLGGNVGLFLSGGAPLQKRCTVRDRTSFVGFAAYLRSPVAKSFDSQDKDRSCPQCRREVWSASPLPAQWLIAWKISNGPPNFRRPSELSESFGSADS
jgi:hypothetical protein